MGVNRKMTNDSEEKSGKMKFFHLKKKQDSNIQYEVNIGKMLTLLILYLFK